MAAIDAVAEFDAALDVAFDDDVDVDDEDVFLLLFVIGELLLKYEALLGHFCEL